MDLTQAHPGREDRRGLRDRADPDHVHLQLVRPEGRRPAASRSKASRERLGLVRLHRHRPVHHRRWPRSAWRLIEASEAEVGLPVAASAIVAGLGVLSVILIIISIISPPRLRRRLCAAPGIDHDPQDRRLARPDRRRSASPTAAGARCRRRGPRFGDEADRFRGRADEAPARGSAGSRRLRRLRRRARPRRPQLRDAPRPGEERLHGDGRLEAAVAQLRRSASWRATREAIAMIVIIGLTPIELGSRLPSAT